MQTNMQNANTVKIGSVMLEVGASLGAMVNVGAIRGFKWSQLGETQKISFDNVAEIIKFTKGNRFKADFTLCEINWDNIQALNSGQVTVTGVAGTLQTVVGEAHGTGWTVASPIICNFKNANNTIVGSIVVKQGATTLTLNTDYKTYVGDGSNGLLGYTYIVPLTAQTNPITFGYTYTPYASKTITFNANGTKTGQYFRITNTDANGKTVVITMSASANVTPLEITFGADNDSAVAEMPLSIEGNVDGISDAQF